MRALASFVMADRWRAALVVAGMALLSLWFPPLLIFSGAALALTTLRRGPQEGALVLAIAALGGALLSLPLFGSVGPMQWILVLFWMPVGLLAWVLRVTVSLARAMQAAAALGALAVSGFYLVLGDPAAWWLNWLDRIGQTLDQTAPTAGSVTESSLLQVLETWAPIIPGILVGGFVISVLGALLLGRWWQALLFNPGGFRQEFHELRLGRPMALVTVAVFAVVLIAGMPLAANLALVLGMIYLLQGIAVAHGVVAKSGLSTFWLVGFYVLLLLVLSQLVMIIGILDAWVDFRARIKPRSGAT